MNPSDEPQSGPGGDERSSGPDLRDPRVHALLDRYWRANVLVTVVLLAVWAVIGLGCSILFADKLNTVRLPGTGFPLGFWFAHQGAIIVFVLLILTYCLVLNRLDAKHHREIEEIRNGRGDGLS